MRNNGLGPHSPLSKSSTIGCVKLRAMHHLVRLDMRPPHLLNQSGFGRCPTCTCERRQRSRLIHRARGHCYNAVATKCAGLPFCGYQKSQIRYNRVHHLPVQPHTIKPLQSHRDRRGSNTIVKGATRSFVSLPQLGLPASYRPHARRAID